MTADTILRPGSTGDSRDTEKWRQALPVGHRASNQS